MKDEELIDKLDKCVIYIEDKELYAINKHHTLLMRFSLQYEYPKMCFAKSNWVNGAKFYRDKEGNLKIRDKSIVLKKEKETITIPQLDINLKEEYESLLKEEMKQLFTLDERFFETIQKYSNTSSFCKIKTEGSKQGISLYDTSKDRTIEYSTRFLVTTGKDGTYFLPTTELGELYNLGFKQSDVWGADDYVHLRTQKDDAILSRMDITR